MLWLGDRRTRPERESLTHEATLDRVAVLRQEQSDVFLYGRSDSWAGDNVGIEH